MAPQIEVVAHPLFWEVLFNHNIEACRCKTAGLARKDVLVM